MSVQLSTVNQIIKTKASNFGNAQLLNGAKKYESIADWKCFKINEISLQINNFEF
jgi:hypothetical protein